MANSFTVQPFHKGHIIFRAGQPGNAAYLIKKGSVDTYNIQDNKKVLIGHLKPGQIFGEMSLVTGSSRLCNAIAREYSELILVDKKLLKHFIKNSPSLVQTIFRSLVNQLNQINKKKAGDFDRSVFFGLCNIMYFMQKAESGMQNKQDRSQARNANQGFGVDFTELSEKIRLIFSVNQLDIDNILKKLNDLYLIDINTKPGTAKKTVKIRDMESFDKVIENIGLQFNARTSDPEFIDIYKFAKMFNTAPDIIYKKIAAEEIPDNLFFINKEGASEWSAEKGENFFKKAKKRRVKIEDIEDVNDIVYVDTPTLRDVFGELGFYKLSVLLTIAEDEANKKIFSCLSKRIATIVREEMQGMENIDEIEAAEIEEEVINMIKEAKGVSK
ncbi:Cyclic nucleotide-binding domain-containing protein [Candidatus Magnetomoraceae bacterium gMMP-13]